MIPLLTETVIRSLTHSDIDAEMMMRSEKPVTIYLRWKEQDLLALSPLVRLLWGTLMNELITTYDTNQGKGCHPVLLEAVWKGRLDPLRDGLDWIYTVFAQRPCQAISNYFPHSLLLLDEAGRTAIPFLADQATTVVGRGITMWVAIQSLSQLEAVYGKARAQVLRDNMETQIYYRPSDLATAEYLERRSGRQSAYAHSTTLKEGEETSQGLSEQGVPLMTAQEIMQLKDEEMICFHRRLPPFKMKRMDWRNQPTLRQRRQIRAPQLSPFPQIADLQSSPGDSQIERFADPDEVLKN